MLPWVAGLHVAAYHQFACRAAFRRLYMVCGLGFSTKRAVFFILLSQRADRSSLWSIHSYVEFYTGIDNRVFPECRVIDVANHHPILDF